MTTATCPTCSGPQVPSHAAGLLAWRHENTCLLRAAEDSTAAADHAQVARWGRFTRPMTSAEATLLSVALGYLIPPNAVTRVERWTASISRRTWPDLPPATPPAAMAALSTSAPTGADRWAEFRDLEGQPATLTVRDPHGELPPTEQHGILVLPPPPETEADA